MSGANCCPVQNLCEAVIERVVEVPLFFVLPKTNTACTVVLCNEALHLKVMDGELRRAAGAAVLLWLQCCRPMGL